VSDAARMPASYDDDLAREPEYDLYGPPEDDDHPYDCDGTYVLADAGFGGQDITYECPHPSHGSGSAVTSRYPYP
jgi:hypothetical protein